MLNQTSLTWLDWKNVCDNDDALLVTMETQTEYDTLKQYMASNAGWFDKSLFWVHIQARNTALQILTSTFPGH